MKVYKKKTSKITVKEIKKVTRYYENKKDPFMHAYDSLVSARLFKAYISSFF